GDGDPTDDRPGTRFGDGLGIQDRGGDQGEGAEEERAAEQLGAAAVRRRGLQAPRLLPAAQDPLEDKEADPQRPGHKSRKHGTSHASAAKPARSPAAAARGAMNSEPPDAAAVRCGAGFGDGCHPESTLALFLPAAGHDQLAPPSSGDEWLHQIRQDLPTSAVEVDAVRVELPSVSLRDLVEAPAEDEEPEGVPVHGQDLDVGEGATGRGANALAEALVERDVDGALLPRDPLDDPTVLVHEPVESVLERVPRVRVFADGLERAQGDARPGPALEFARDPPQ